MHRHNSTFAHCLTKQLQKARPALSGPYREVSVFAEFQHEEDACSQSYEICHRVLLIIRLSIEQHFTIMQIRISGLNQNSSTAEREP